MNCPPKADLQRHKDVPLLAVFLFIRQEDQGGQLDDIVLTGRLQAPFTDEITTMFVSADEGQDNPFQQSGRLCRCQREKTNF